MHQNIKDISITAILTALGIALSFLIPSIVPFAVIYLIIISHSFKFTQSLIFAFVFGALSYFTTGQLLTMTNMFFYPFIVLMLKLSETFVYGQKFEEVCSHAIKKSSYLKLGLLTFGLVFFANIVNQIIWVDD